MSGAKLRCRSWRKILPFHECQPFFTTLLIFERKGKKAYSRFGRIPAIKCGAKHHICCSEVCSYRSSGERSPPNMTSQDIFPKNFPKFLRTVPFVTRNKKADFIVRYLSNLSPKSFKTSDFDYSRYYLSF